MKGSWKLGQLAGIGVFMHWSFLLLPAWIGMATLGTGAGLAKAIMSVAFVLVIFGCVVLHELGHALAARRYGIETRDITLLPIGGVARLERMPERPAHELVVALAGPAVNVVIAAALFVGLTLGGGIVLSPDLLGGSFLTSLMLVNVVLVVFNLLPAFPMDGGRVLRALLATQLPYARATRIAATVGQAMAILFAILGLFTSWTLMLVALFVFLAARAEARMAEMQTSFEGATAGDAMLREFRVLPAETGLADAAVAMWSSPLREVPVVRGPHFIGLLAKDDVFGAAARSDGHRTVGDLARHDLPVVEEHDPLSQIFTRMQAGPYTSLPVVRDGRLVGMLTQESLRTWLKFRAARQALPPHPHQAPWADPNTPIDITPLPSPTRS